MMPHDRDALIRAALTPRDDLQLPVDLAGEIHRAISATAQRRPLLRGFGGVLSLPRIPAAVAWLVLLAALLGAIAVGIASRPDPLPSAVLNYHGNQGLTGEMPGPGPQGPVAIGWESSLDGPVTNLLMPLVKETRIHMALGNGRVATLDTATGALVRSTEDLGEIRGTPVIAADRLVVAAVDGTVIAFDESSGAERWRHMIGSPTQASLATIGSFVLVGDDAGSVHVLDLESGAEVHEVDAGGPVERSPASADGVVYVGASGGRITAFEAATGSIRWTAALGDGEVLTPAVRDGVVYIARGPLDLSEPHEVVALDAAGGHVLWRSAGPSFDRLFVAAVSNVAVFVVSEDHNVYRLDARTGEFERHFETQGSIGSLATLADDTLYVTSSDQHVYAIDPDTGSERWRLEVEGSPSMPVVVDGRVIIGTSLGKVYSIEGTDTR